MVGRVDGKPGRSVSPKLGFKRLSAQTNKRPKSLQSKVTKARIVAEDDDRQKRSVGYLVTGYVANEPTSFQL